MRSIKRILLFLLTTSMYIFAQAEISFENVKTIKNSKSKSNKSYAKSSGSTYALGNYVWFDYNKNGLQDYGEQSLADVTLKLYDNSNCTGTSIMTTSTTSIGTYILIIFLLVQKNIV